MFKIFKKLKKYSWVIGIIKNADKEDRKNVIDGYKNRKKYYTSPLDDFDADLKEMAKCANCPNMCRFDCPAVLIPKVETFAPANKSRIGLFMGMDHVPMNEQTAIDTMYACMNCDACYEWCPMEISTGNLLQEMRVELDKRDLIPDRLHKLKENPKSNGSVFEESPFKKYAGNTKFDHNHEDPEVLYYIGCMDLKYRKESVKATMALLEHLGIPYCTKLEERQCCGGPIDKVGYRSVAKPLAEQNTDLIDDSGVDTVITTCPGCLETLKITYNEDLDVKQKVDVVHAINFFNDKIKNGELKLTEKIEKDITYHDPCILSRTSSKVANADLARELFNKIPGLAIKEPYLNKNETRCCGMGGGYHVSNPDYSKEVGLDRYQQLEKLDTDYIVSGCPTCEYALLEAQEEKEGKAKDVEDGQQIIDIVELLAESAGLEY